MLPKIPCVISILRFSIVGNSKINYFQFRVPHPPQWRPLGGGLWAQREVWIYTTKSCVISILGFSLVGYSKMILIFILGYSQPLQGHPRGGGRKPRGGLSPTPPKIMFYINFRVYNSGKFKIIFIFILGVPHPPQGRSRTGRGRGPRGS